MRRDGFVLVTTLWVLAIATVMVMGFSHRAFLQARAASFSLDQTQARFMAQAAVQRGIIELRNKFYKDRLVQEEQGLSVTTHQGQPWAQTMALHEEGGFFDLGEGYERDGVWLNIIDADRYININTAPDTLLENIEGLNRGVIRSILRRRSDETYEGDGIAYFQAVEELRYLRGMKDEDWFGEDDRPGVRNLFSVWGGPLVNINTAPREVLACIPKLDKAAVDAILAYRGDGQPGVDGQPAKGTQGFASFEEIEEHTGIRGDALQSLKQHCSFNSGYFIISGLATRQGGKVRVEIRAVVNATDGDSALVDWQEVTVGS